MSENTRDKLLDVGEKLFAEKGIEGVSIRELAREAGVNLAAVHYHFQGKQGLYEEVIRRRVIPKRERILAALAELRERADAPTLEDVVRAIIDAHIRDTLDPSHWETSLRLFAREVHTQGNASEVIQAEMILPMRDVALEMVKASRPDIDERRLVWVVMSAIGQVLFFMMRWYARRTGHGVGGSAMFDGVFPDDHQEFIEMVVDHVARLTAAGAEAFAGSAARREES